MDRRGGRTTAHQDLVRVDGKPLVVALVREAGAGHDRPRFLERHQIDGRWTDAIEADFTQSLRQNIDGLPVGREQIEQILKQR